MDYMWFWLIVFVVLLVCELATTALISVWFCGGALFALFADLLGIPFVVQIAVFVAVSIILLVLTRPFVKKISKKEVLKTNVDNLIGKKAMVTRKIDNSQFSGEVNINGQIWSAISVDDEIIEPLQTVVVEKIQGVKAVVKSV